MKWYNVKLNDILTLEYGRALKKDVRDSSGSVPVAGSNGIDGWHKESLVNGPGIVVGRKGSAGKVTWFDTAFWPIDTTYYVKVKQNLKCNIRWIYYLLNHLNLDRLSIFTGVPGLNRNDAYKMTFALPPLSEQKRIVEILDQADTLRIKCAEADAKTAHILPSLFYKMFGDPAMNSEGWKMVDLKDVCTRITDGTHQPPPFTDKGIPFLFVQNIVSGVIDFDTQKYVSEETYKDLTRNIKPERGDILYSTVGSYGIAVEVETDNRFVFQRHIGHIKPHHETVDVTFLCTQLNTSYVRSQADQRVRGIAQKTLNLSELRQFKIILPPLDLQRSFSTQVKSMRHLVALRRHLSEKVNTLFSLLLHRAFTGDLTAKWSDSHMKELLKEMEEQAKELSFEKF